MQRSRRSLATATATLFINNLVELSFNGLWISDRYPCSRSTRTGYNNHSELSYLGYLGAVTSTSCAYSIRKKASTGG